MIELVIVMVIISALLMITMNVSFRSVDGIRARYEGQQLQDELYRIVSLTQQSDMIKGIPYTDITVSLDATRIQSTAGGNTIGLLSLKETTLTFAEGPLKVKLKPYILGCEVIQGNPTNITLAYKKQPYICFQLDLGTCKLIASQCSTP